jgi:hypothetical protein
MLAIVSRKDKNPAAVELGKLRAANMNEDERRELARSGGVVGGKARAGALTKRRRTAIAKAAAAARWSKQKRD